MQDTLQKQAGGKEKMRRTKIVCTMGPNTDKKPIMEALVKNGKRRAG